MIHLNKIFILICLLTFCSSCNSFLDTEPEDYLTTESYYETGQQLQNALNAVYSTLGHYTLYGREMHRMGLDADDGFYDVVNTLNGVKVYDVAATDYNVADFWETCYVGINRANNLLANINVATDISDDERGRIQGEALFLRGYLYFLLVSNFGGVPYVTEPTQETGIARTDPKEIYLGIIADMEAAEALVQTASEVVFGGKVSQSAVRGILARVNLYMAGEPVKDVSRYEEARKWAKKIIDDTESGHTLLPDFKQVFINYAADEYDIRESIWEVEFYGNNQDVYREGGQIGAYNGIRYTGDDPDYGYSLGMVNASGTLWDKYEDAGSLESEDLRRDWTIFGSTVTDNPAVETPRPLSQIYQRDCGKYRRQYEVVLPKDRQYTPINFPLLRFSDVLLMFAEADNEVNGGPTGEAYEAVNQVRRRGYGLSLHEAAEGVDFQGLDQAGFRRAIQDERSRELAFECLRKGDLVRWGVFVDRMTEARNHAIDASLPSSLDHAMRYFNNASDRDVLWPIPSYEMGVNDQLVQNPGW